MPAQPAAPKTLILAALIALAALPARAAPSTTEGHAALALAVITAQYNPSLPTLEKIRLLHLLADQAYGRSRTGSLALSAGEATCRAGDVDIKAYQCTLTFGASTIALTGRRAAELYATLEEAGIPSDGAAGTLYESAKTLACTLNLTELGGPGTGDGGGATCTYTPG